MAAPTFVSGQQNSSSVFSTSITLSLPDTPTENNLIVAVILFPGTNAGGTITAPSGWQEDLIQVRSTVAPRLGFYSKLAGDSETNSYQWSWSGGTSQTAQGWIFEVTGNATSDWLDAAEGTDGGGTNRNSLTINQPAASDVNTLAIAAVALNSSGGGFDSAWTNGYAALANSSRLATGYKSAPATSASSTFESWANSLQAVGGIAIYKGASDISVTPSEVAASATISATVDATSVVQASTVAGSVGITTPSTNGESSVTVTPDAVLGLTIIGTYFAEESVIFAASVVEANARIVNPMGGVRVSPNTVTASVSVSPQTIRLPGVTVYLGRPLLGVSL